MSEITNITEVAFNGATTTRTAPLYQYDYGQKLQFTDIYLPSYTEVHFSNSETGNAIVMLATDGLVSIPDDLLRTGKAVFAWIFVHSGDSDGETIYRVSIPVLIRAKPSEETPTPTEQSIIEQAITALNDTLEVVEPVADRLAKIPEPSTDTDKTLQLVATVASGEVTYSWIENNTLTR